MKTHSLRAEFTYFKSHKAPPQMLELHKLKGLLFFFQLENIFPKYVCEHSADA